MGIHTHLETVEFWIDPTLKNLELLHATYITHRFVPHTHEGFAIGVIQRGVEVFDYRKQTHTATSGNIVVINPGESHTGHAGQPEGWTYRMLYPDAHILQEAAAAVAGHQRDIPFFPDPVLQDDVLTRLLLNLHRMLQDPAASILARESYLLWVMTQLVTRHADDRPVMPDTQSEPARVRRLCDFLEHHYATNVTLTQLSSLVNLSPFHLLRVFHHSMGVSPHVYLTQIRIRQAKKLLLAGVPLVDVAQQTGFADQSHFTKRFKRITGVTPAQYRKNVQYK